jgi:hypothetical protein
MSALQENVMVEQALSAVERRAEWKKPEWHIVDASEAKSHSGSTDDHAFGDS